MNKILCALGMVTIISTNSYAVSVGTVGGAPIDNKARISSSSNDANARGNQANANAYRDNQKNTYFMVTQPDVDTACRTKIFKCLADYCGDVTAIPGQRNGRCDYATESELYNYSLLCLQKDSSVLLPQYNTNTKNGTGAGMNTAARLCPSYVQQELASYLSMANMSEQLSKTRSSLCLTRRLELETASTCHSIAMAYSNETTSMLTSQLRDYCGAGVPGGSAEMVTRFSSAGNVGANIWGWAEKMVNLDMNKKGADWQMAVDSVLAGYTNRMNIACGENVKLETTSYTTSENNGGPTSLQTVAALAVGTAFPGSDKNIENPYESWSIWQEVQSASDLRDFATAKQVVQAGLTSSSTTQNDFLSSAQMDSMQKAYKLGTKMFIIKDSSRCYTIAVAALDSNQQSLIAQAFAGCVSR